ncbi:hypothetical protein H7F33_06160 [Pedobacter sp. PAMC26386]|nr:hypothetical protein H7F33_06160 [Pedobacter sp. PAMC26386]
MKKTGYVFPNLIRFYLSDLLAVPLVATLGMWFMRWILQQQDLVLMRWQVVFIVLLFGILFELILPPLMKRYTGDLADAGMYAIGGLFFWKIMNK